MAELAVWYKLRNNLRCIDFPANGKCAKAGYRPLVQSEILAISSAIQSGAFMEINQAWETVSSYLRMLDTLVENNEEYRLVAVCNSKVLTGRKNWFVRGVGYDDKYF